MTLDTIDKELWKISSLTILSNDLIKYRSS